MDDEPSMSQFASKADYDAAADAAELKRLRAMFAAATEIQGDDEVLKYVTSGNAIPVTRCTVSADLIRQLVARSAVARRDDVIEECIEECYLEAERLRSYSENPNDTSEKEARGATGCTHRLRALKDKSAAHSAIAAIPHVNQLKKFAGEVTGVGAVVMGDSAIVEAYRAMLRTADSGI